MRQGTAQGLPSIFVTRGAHTHLSALTGAARRQKGSNTCRTLRSAHVKKTLYPPFSRQQGSGSGQASQVLGGRKGPETRETEEAVLREENKGRSPKTPVHESDLCCERGQSRPPSHGPAAHIPSPSHWSVMGAGKLGGGKARQGALLHSAEMGTDSRPQACPADTLEHRAAASHRRTLGATTPRRSHPLL